MSQIEKTEGRAMGTPLQRNPIYQQLNDRLRTMLAAEYKRGDRFMTEREIAQRFEVSRATANKALASLVSEGMLDFRRGIGTFVRRDVIDYDVQSLRGYPESDLFVSSMFRRYCALLKPEGAEHGCGGTEALPE